MAALTASSTDTYGVLPVLIHAFKIGIWSFFPRGYLYLRGELNNEHRLLTREQAEFVENKVRNSIIEFDFVAVKWKNGISRYEGEVEGVYLIGVKTGRGADIRYYAKNPIRAFLPENLEKAKPCF